MIKITKASPNDLPVLASLFDRYRIFYKEKSDIKTAMAFLSGRIANNDAQLFVCWNSTGMIVGFMQLYPLFSSTAMKKLWLLNDLFVHEDFRGMGYSMALIDKAKALCSETGAHGIILETAKDNTAGNRLYPKMGFMRDTAHNYYSWKIGQ